MLTNAIRRRIILFEPGDVVVADFPGVQGFKRRPAVVLSSEQYHKTRSDTIKGLITSQMTAAIAPSDCSLEDWKIAGLKKPSAFRSFTVPQGYVIKNVGRLS